MFGWLKKRGHSSAENDLPTEGGHDFLEVFRPGPDPVPPGEYAMWLPSSGEPSFALSATRKHIGRIYRAAEGVATFAFAGILRQLGEVDESTLRVALPDELVTITVLGPDDQVIILSASEEKGVRFHFHQSATPAYRERVLSGFVAHLAFLRRAITLSGSPLDASCDPQAWWQAIEHVLADSERKGEPTTAVGMILLG